MNQLLSSALVATAENTEASRREACGGQKKDREKGATKARQTRDSGINHASWVISSTNQERRMVTDRYRRTFMISERAMEDQST